MAVRRYAKYGRTPIPRNKYGNLYNIDEFNSFNNSSSVYGSGEGASVVGATMATINDFTGATEFNDGVRGLVPGPAAGEQEYFLQATGAWRDIPASRWMSEWPGGGLENRGLSVNGDLNVTDTLSVMNLSVQGAAKFWSLIIDEVSANGGQVLVSPSMFKVDYIGGVELYPVFTEDSKIIDLISCRKDIDKMFRAVGVSAIKARRLWQRDDDGDRSIYNEVVVGDMLRCRSFNVESDKYHDISNTDYWSFVVGVGEGSFTDEDGVEKSGFWIDLAYSLKCEDGRNIPLSSLLKEDGSVDYPSYYVGDTHLDELKSVSNTVLTGDGEVDPEEFDSEEYREIQRNVLKIRGLESSVSRISGRSGGESSGDEDFTASEAALDFIATGSVSGASATDLSSLILNGSFSEDGGVGEDNSSIQEQALLRSGDILRSNYLDLENNPYYLDIKKVSASEITIKEGSVSERAFIAADNLYDTGGNLIYTKGDTIPLDTTFLGDWKVFDKINEDIVIGVDEESGSEFIPDNLTEINEQTNNTGEGKSRDVDYFLDNDLETATEFLFGYGEFRVKVGDSLACLGHLYLSERQNAIVISAQDPIDPDLIAPAMAQYKGIYLFGESISSFRMTAIAANGNEFLGSFLVNYNNSYVEINDRIQMFVNDITTGLEKVGIHLDGESSTITLVGNVELRQHASDSYDSLSVFDNLDTKRVEILPSPIPRRNSSDSSIDISTNNFRTISSEKNATKGYIKYDSYRHWYFWPFNSSMVYTYELKSYNIVLESSVNLGQISVDPTTIQSEDDYPKLDLSNLKLKLNADTYLCGSVRVTNHGSGKQSVSGINYTIKRDGVPLEGYNNKVLKSPSYTHPGLSISGLDTDVITVNLGSAFVDDLKIRVGGSYSVDISVSYNVYAYYKSWDKKYSNYYYSIRSGLSGSVRSAVQRQVESGNNNNSLKMTIGTDGMVFNCNNSRYFYAGSDGYELNWDGFGLKMDSGVGVCVTKFYEVVSSGKYLSNKSDYIIAQYSSNGYDLYVPSASDWGSGRPLTVIAFRGLRLKTRNSEVFIAPGYDPSHSWSGDTLEFGTGSSYSMSKYNVELVPINGSWYILNYL